MSARLYAGTALKCAAFIMLCLFVKVFSYNALPVGLQSVVCAAMSMLFTFLFLVGIETRERQFLAPSYGYAGMTSGIIMAGATAGAPVLFELIRGELKLQYHPEGFDILTCVLVGFEGLFTAFMIFGYIFIIIKEDFKWFDAAVVCVLLNIIYTDIFIYDFLPDFGDIKYDTYQGVLTVDPATLDGRQMICIINVILMSVLIFMMTHRYGDVRPAAAFMFIFNSLLYLLSHLFTAKLGSITMLTGVELYSTFALSAAMIVEIIVMIVTL